MPLEANRSLINTGVATVPGINRNGAFISEAPIDTFIVFKSGAFTANQSKSFFIEFPSSLRSFLTIDTTAAPNYTIVMLTPEGSTWTFAYTGTLISSLGSTKTINAQNPFILEKGTKITFTANNAISGLVMFFAPALSIDVRDF